MDDAAIPATEAWPALGAHPRNSYRVSDQVVDMRRHPSVARSARLKAQPQDVVFDVARSAIIVVDMQNDFCGDGGWIEGMGVDTSKARALAAPINRATAALRAKDAPVIWLNWGLRPDRANLSPSTLHPFNPNGAGPGLAGPIAGGRSYNVLQKDSWGAQVIDEMVRKPQDIAVDKHRISGFWDTPLNSILQNLDVKTLFFAGVNADHCVLGTLMDANFHGYDTILLEDCTGTTSPDFCMQATLHNVRFCFGFTATSADLDASLAAV